MRKILIIEDDSEINRMEQKLLEHNQYETVSAFSGTEGLLLLEREDYDLVLLDIMLPGLEGGKVLERIREKSDIPVICVSAKDDMQSRLDIMRNGADDYLIKPFHNEELLVRIETVLRRSSISNGNIKNILKYQDIVIDQDSMSVTVLGKLIELTSKEYQILELLMKNPKKVFTKQNIFESVWNECFVDDSAVTVHVSNLRNKLGEDKNKYIKTVWGIGYKMQD